MHKTWTEDLHSNFLILADLIQKGLSHESMLKQEEQVLHAVTTHLSSVNDIQDACNLIKFNSFPLVSSVNPEK